MWQDIKGMIFIMAVIAFLLLFILNKDKPDKNK